MRILHYAGLALLSAALGGCRVASVSSMLPATSANPFGGAAGRPYVLPIAVAKVANTAPGFGPYQVSSLRRGWGSTTSYRTPLRAGATGSPVLDVLNLPYEQLQTTSNRKSQFHFADSLGHAADVYATSRATTQDVSFALGSSGQLSQRQKASATYSAVIVGPQIGATNAWNLLLSFPDPDRIAKVPDALVGVLGDNEQVLYQVRLVPHLPLTSRNGQSVPWPPAAGPGAVELLQQGQRAAYIDFSTAHPVVWLRGDLSPEARFLAATTCSTILLRTGW